MAVWSGSVVYILVGFAIKEMPFRGKGYGMKMSSLLP